MAKYHATRTLLWVECPKPKQTANKTSAWRGKIKLRLSIRSLSSIVSSSECRLGFLTSFNSTLGSFGSDHFWLQLQLPPLPPSLHRMLLPLHSFTGNSQFLFLNLFQFLGFYSLFLHLFFPNFNFRVFNSIGKMGRCSTKLNIWLHSSFFITLILPWNLLLIPSLLFLLLYVVLFSF